MNKKTPQLSEDEILILGIIYQLSGKAREDTALKKTDLKDIPSLGGVEITTASIVKRYQKARPFDQRKLDTIRRSISQNLTKLLSPIPHIQKTDKSADVGNNIRNKYGAPHEITETGIEKLKELIAPRLQPQQPRSKQNNITPFGYKVMQAINSFQLEQAPTSLAGVLKADEGGIVRRYKQMTPEDIRDESDITKDVKSELLALRGTSYIKQKVSSAETTRIQTTVRGTYVLEPEGTKILTQRPSQQKTTPTSAPDEEQNSDEVTHLEKTILEKVNECSERLNTNDISKAAIVEAVFKLPNIDRNTTKGDIKVSFDKLVDRGAIQKTTQHKGLRDRFSLTALGRNIVDGKTKTLPPVPFKQTND